MARVMRAVVKPSEGGAMGNFVEGAASEPSQFTRVKRELPNHNPKQPHLNLPMGPHTHGAARAAVHFSQGQMGPSMTYTGCVKPMPAAEKATHAKANENDRVQSREPDYDEDRYRGKSGVD